jgi:hypothetical protein
VAGTEGQNDCDCGGKVQEVSIGIIGKEKCGRRKPTMYLPSIYTYRWRKEERTELGRTEANREIKNELNIYIY